MLRKLPHIVGLVLVLSVGGRGVAATETKISAIDLLKLAEAQQAAALETLERLVNIDTGTGNVEGLSRAEAVLVDRLGALGAAVVLKPAEKYGGNTIIGTLKGTGDTKIMLMCHYDTVFEPGEPGRRPFRKGGERLYGPGVADAKGGIAIMLHAVEVLKKLDFDRFGTLTLFFNPDEEKGSLGSRDLIRELANQHDYVLSFDPPEKDAVTTATNGINYVFLKVRGVASHAGSAPEKGRNAVTELAHQLLQLQDLGDLGKKTTVNWTIVNGGTRRNIIPDEANAEADMRYSDYCEVERVTRAADTIVQNRLVPDTEVEFILERGRPPLSPNDASDKLASLSAKLYQESGHELGSVAMRFGTDAGYAYSPDNPKPAVLETLGIVGAKIHTSDEYAELNSVAPRLYLTAALVMALSEQD